MLHSLRAGGSELVQRLQGKIKAFRADLGKGVPGKLQLRTGVSRLQREMHNKARGG